MKKVLRKIFNRFVKRHLPKSFVKKLKMSDSVSFPIIKHPNDIFNLIYHIKDATWESVVMPEVYEMSKNYPISLRHPAQDILKIPNAIVTPGSDVVLTPKGAVWDKYYLPMFPYMKVSDSNVTEHNADVILLRKPSRKIHVDGECVSMLGTCESLWVHFLVQFLPKLYYSEEAGILNRDVSVILPDYRDSHIRQLVEDVLQRHLNVKPIWIDAQSERVEVECDFLYWIPTATAESNDNLFPLLQHHIVPKKVAEILREKVFEKYIEQAKKSKNMPEKIYLVRRSRYRNMSNVDEVEEFFKNEGFTFVEPHKMSLQEKVNLFYHAKIVAGANSSAWGNTMFCNHARGVMLTPLSWILDTLVGYCTLEGECRIIEVPCYEEYVGAQNNFYVSIDTLKKAYKQILLEKI